MGEKVTLGYECGLDKNIHAAAKRAQNDHYMKARKITLTD
jgi:hypothetical protein|tara:strand:+ start:14174 stop:14293 length:120 start_codon:yes stop_codon:yes gene_type:complete